MLSLRDHFWVGYRAGSSGSSFRIAELLEPHAATSVATLRAKIAVELHQSQQQAEARQSDLHYVQHLSEQQSVRLSPVPKHATAYIGWLHLLQKRYLRVVPYDSPQGVSFCMGLQTGKAASLLDALGALLRVSEAVVGIPAFQAQWEHLQHNLETTARELGRLGKLCLLLEGSVAPLHDQLYVPAREAISATGVLIPFHEGQALADRAATATQEGKHLPQQAMIARNHLSAEAP